MKRFDKKKIFYIVMTLLIALEIFLFSGITTSAGEKTGLNLATLYHLSVFFAFTFFLSLTLIKDRLDKRTIAIILLLSLAYAISDEFHQLFVIGRFASLKDMLIDFTGSILSVLVIKMVEIYKKI
jgi:VanZ family protein